MVLDQWHSLPPAVLLSLSASGCYITLPVGGANQRLIRLIGHSLTHPVIVPAVVVVETCEIIKGLLDSPLALAAMQQVCSAHSLAICSMNAIIRSPDLVVTRPCESYGC
jgi:hypothetical protein